MKLLLDTHALLWFCDGNAALSGKARAAMEDERNERWVSHATAWEIAIKAGLGKLALQVPYEELFPGVIAANGWQVLAPDFLHYRELLVLPLHHRDPFDRLLVAQARVEGLTLVSADPHFPAYDVPVLW
jgi:PIN domain nuclease of toxin-antitoxin system